MKPCTCGGFPIVGPGHATVCAWFGPDEDDVDQVVPTPGTWQVQLFRDNDHAFHVGKRIGAQGRGSRARYRRAVVERLTWWKTMADGYACHVAYERRLFETGDGDAGRLHEVGVSAVAFTNAARRARTLLERLDEGRIRP